MRMFYHNGYLWKVLEQERGYYLDLSEYLEYDITVVPKNGLFEVHIGLMLNGYEDERILLCLAGFDKEELAFEKAEAYSFYIMQNFYCKYDHWYKVNPACEVLKCTLSNGKTRFFSMTRASSMVFANWWDSNEGDTEPFQEKDISNGEIVFTSRHDAKSYLMRLLKQFRIIGRDVLEQLEPMATESLLL